MGYVAEFIKHISKRSQIVAHQLIWNMQTNMYVDEEQMHKDGELKRVETVIMVNNRVITNNCSSVRHFGQFDQHHHWLVLWRRETVLRAGV